MCMASPYMLAILCCHIIDWDISLRYWCLSQIICVAAWQKGHYVGKMKIEFGIACY